MNRWKWPWTGWAKLSGTNNQQQSGTRTIPPFSFTMRIAPSLTPLPIPSHPLRLDAMISPQVPGVTSPARRGASRENCVVAARFAGRPAISGRRFPPFVAFRRARGAATLFADSGPRPLFFEIDRMLDAIGISVSQTRFRSRARRARDRKIVFSARPGISAESGQIVFFG